uniref:Replication protein A C-terminal domain-containing protein n=1 Tax=Pseudo-nitzschia australis TaxID=44445 RepID=A0A7S4EK63_9STRA|mmetsp:Transcript_22453/g.48847  ORF Transcript_22453/g.48847 Transcript_22453/m.48847 type:complete len:144 (-) Transcript_22453:359-790(-)|eukprot:CAMPEP_0168186380 /NCGR_PEP_ID=MMETSP0139_2-20121125/14394_1 /TAXON_ID=44445 /ORGANISM="Pseudo-nitzschia australis, Strain 10249 10 AB" /LENGTH=143 /DNA_ID=CAMNT_0008108369 /DNA_START=94 /DNA_END=525 /DNA_ORIENTATION=+
MDEQQYNDEQDGGGGAQVDGAFARVNGGMLQSGRFTNQIVSLVGQVTAHDTIRSADGSNVHVITEHLTGDDEEGGSGGGLIVDPNTVVEIMGQASGPTEITAFIQRELGTDMDLTLYNQMITMQHQDKFAQYFAPAPASADDQ